MAKPLLWNKNEPIIRSLLETDVYKILMMNFIWSFYSSLEVKFRFMNRTKNISVAKYVDKGELQEQLDAVTELRFTKADITYLRTWGMLSEEFLTFLSKFRLPRLEVRDAGETYEIVASGRWLHVTLWEIYVLAIVSELYGRGYARALEVSEKQLWKEGVKRLEPKIDFFKKHDLLRILQFALRRRMSGPWEEYMTERFLTETKVFTGVSNVHLARHFDAEPQGTNAHELPMAVYALMRHVSYEAARNSVYTVLEQWQELYAQKGLIMLSDTFGSDRFMKLLPDHYGAKWRGFRQDSGDPIAFGESVIKYYGSLDHVYGVDPREKMIIFSDGLTPERAEEIRSHFEGRIITGFGMGTNLSNDFGLIVPLSLVMKIMEAAGNPAIKLSDNLNKATGDSAEIEIAKYIFGYTNQFRESLVY